MGACMRAPNLYRRLHVRLSVLPNLKVLSRVCLNVLANMYAQLYVLPSLYKSVDVQRN